jgi:diguanylate cyclase (GGDEF)-like protein
MTSNFIQAHRILVVDDEVNVRKAISRVLKRKGYTIVTARDGTEGLDLLRRDKFSVVISDQRMPGMEGTEMLKHARVVSPDTVRILLTAHADITALQQAINQGEIYRFLMKPWEANALANDVNDAIQYYQLKAEKERINQEIHKQVQQLSQVNRELLNKISNQSQQLTQATQYDPLTLLPNRSLLVDVLQATVAESRVTQKLVAVLMIDIDRFDLVNQSMGYESGDLLLFETAQRLLDCVRDDDTVARLSSDEFVMVLRTLDNSQNIEPLIKRIHVELSKPFFVNNQEVFLSASIGISLYPHNGQCTTDLLEAAAIALKHAKAVGNGVHQYFDTRMNQRVKRIVDLERRLHYAIDRQEFQVYYQPQIALRSGAIVGAEALLRWHPAEGEIIGPAEFVPVLEETGMIQQVGEQVLTMVGTQAAKWNQLGLKPLRIGVNLSARQFQSNNLVSIVESLLTSTDLPPHVLDLEITETSVMLDIAKAINTLNELHALGVNMSIDDFGTGYASLSYLTRFPVHALKIDCSFVQGIPERKNDAMITNAIIALGHNLNLRVIAEGVETAEQLAFLRERNCDEIQGYYFSPAVDVTEFEKMLRDNKTLDDVKSG